MNDHQYQRSNITMINDKKSKINNNNNLSRISTISNNSKLDGSTFTIK